jgi:hypothetical protein
VLTSEPQDASQVVAHLQPETIPGQRCPGIVAREFGKGKVVYLPAALDAALWSYSFPYQRCLLTQAVQWAARRPCSVHVEAPMCVQATFFEQEHQGRRRQVIHLFNGLNTTGGHGQPLAEVPLREETVPIHNIRVTFAADLPRRCRFEPEGIDVRLTRDETTGAVTSELPPLAIHGMLVAVGGPK